MSAKQVYVEATGRYRKENAKTARSSQRKRKKQSSLLYGISLPAFEELVEETYPDIDLQIEQNAYSTIDGEAMLRLRHGHGTDLVAMRAPMSQIADYVMD